MPTTAPESFNPYPMKFCLVKSVTVPIVVLGVLGVQRDDKPPVCPSTAPLLLMATGAYRVPLKEVTVVNVDPWGVVGIWSMVSPAAFAPAMSPLSFILLATGRAMIW